jgi:hypothetical protein
MSESQQHRRSASDDGSIVDTSQANTPVDEQPSRDREPRDNQRDDQRDDAERRDIADAADPSEPSEKRRSRIGSAGGGSYPPLSPSLTGH